jgi:hypothetical protein
MAKLSESSLLRLDKLMNDRFLDADESRAALGCERTRLRSYAREHDPAHFDQTYEDFELLMFDEGASDA